MLKHFAYIQYVCGIPSEASCGLNHDTPASFGFGHTPIFQNLAPTPHRYYSVRVNPHAHSQHIKVLKHIVYIQYGCGMQSEASCSLNHDTPASFGFGHTPIFQNLAPTALTGICRKPPRYVPYKGTYVLYDGTYGAPDQGQTLDVREGQIAKSALRDDWTRDIPHHTLEGVLEVILEHMCTGLRP